MLVYYIMLGVPLLTAILFRLSKRRQVYTLENRKSFNPTILVFFIILFLILILRDYHIGSDTLGYKVLYNNISDVHFGKIFSTYDREYGFVILTKLFRLINPSFRFFLAVTTLFSLIPVAWYYQKESDYPLLTIVLFVTVAPFTMYFSGLRQIIAMALGIIAWKMAKERKLIWFIVIVMAAMLFHASAIVLFAVYPLYRVKITAKWLFVVVPAIILVYIFNKPIFSFLVTFLWKEYGQNVETGGYTVLLLLIAFAVYAYIMPDSKLMDEETIALRNILLLSIAMQCFAPIHPLAMRMNYYFLLFVPVLITKIAVRAKYQYKKFAEVSVLVMLVGFTAYYYYHAYTGTDILKMYPYIGVWQ